MEAVYPPNRWDASPCSAWRPRMFPSPDILPRPQVGLLVEVMVKSPRVRSALSLVLALGLLASATAPLRGQVTRNTDGQRIASVEQSLSLSGFLTGNPGPTSVNWIDGGNRFSYTVVNPQTRSEEIRLYDPATQQDAALLDGSALTLPGDAQPLAYESFQWADDSRHILFLTDFRPIYRNSGVSDFYLYDRETRSLRVAADDARTPQLSGLSAAGPRRRSGLSRLSSISRGSQALSPGSRRWSD